MLVLACQTAYLEGLAREPTTSFPLGCLGLSTNGVAGCSDACEVGVEINIDRSADLVSWAWAIDWTAAVHRCPCPNGTSLVP